MLVLVTALTCFTGTTAEYSCQGLTVTNCEVDNGLFIQDFNMSSATACQTLCQSFTNCNAFTFYLGHCELWRDNPRTSCALVSGPPTLDAEQCITGSIITAGCDGYVEAECKFLGSDTAYTSIPGEIVSAVECGHVCKVLADLNLSYCTYWVYNDSSQVCHMLDSDQRICLGLTGPKDPIIPCKEEEDKFHASEHGLDSTLLSYV